MNMRWADPAAEQEREWHRRFQIEGLSFDDVLLVPGYARVLPDQVEVRAPLTRRITLGIPIVSAAMDTVTDARLAIALAQEGGLGVIHRNLAIEEQAGEVDKLVGGELLVRVLGYGVAGLVQYGHREGVLHRQRDDRHFA